MEKFRQTYISDIQPFLETLEVNIARAHTNITQYIGGLVPIMYHAPDLRGRTFVATKDMGGLIKIQDYYAANFQTHTTSWSYENANPTYHARFPTQTDSLDNLKAYVQAFYGLISAWANAQKFTNPYFGSTTEYLPDINRLPPDGDSHWHETSYRGQASDSRLPLRVSLVNGTSIEKDWLNHPVTVTNFWKPIVDTMLTESYPLIMTRVPPPQVLPGPPPPQ